MQIVITDGYTLNPGDLSWAPFYELGEVIYYDRTAAADIGARCRTSNIIVTNKTPIDASTIMSAADLRLIAVTATGYNMVDVAAAQKRGIPVSNVPEYGTDSVAQHTFALLLELSNGVGGYDRSVRDGDWQRSPDFCYSRTALIELKGKTLGLVGFGRIARQVARIAEAFGMWVLYNSRSALVQSDNAEAGSAGSREGAGKGMLGSETIKTLNIGGFHAEVEKCAPRAVSLARLFAESDFISLHCPLTPDNHSFINAGLLSLMKPTAFLINTARGQLINERDLAEALTNRRLSGAALDVLATEPPPAGHPLIGLPNCLLTPHIAWMSWEARQRLLTTTADNIRAALAGTPQNVVNP